MLFVSAAEMLTLFSKLRALIDDLVPEDDKTWKIFLLLHETLQISLDTIFSKDCGVKSFK